MKSLSDQNVKELSSVETSTWVVDVFGNNDKVKVIIDLFSSFACNYVCIIV